MHSKKKWYIIRLALCVIQTCSPEEIAIHPSRSNIRKEMQEPDLSSQLPE